MSTIHAERLSFRTSAEVEMLAHEFADCTLPRERWTHQAHLTVALWYLARHTRAEATRLIREGIKRYNRACGVRTTPTSGYHETLTLFWIRIVGGYLERAAGDSRSLVHLVNGLLSDHDTSLPLNYYSRERLMSGEARARWVEPDLKALD